MKQSQFDAIIPRQGTCAEKWDRLEELFGAADILPMWVADMDFTAPSAVIEAIQKRAAHGVYGYPFRTASFYEAICSWMQRRHGWEISPEWILNTPGVVPGISATIQAFTKPGDKVIVQPPVYRPFSACVVQNGRQVVENPLVQDGDRYVMDFDHLRQAAREGAKMILLCNPHNPVGRSWTAAELRQLSEICLEHEIVLVSDEIHSDLIFKGHRHTPLASLSPEIADHTITLAAPSKTFNLAGLSMAMVIVANETLRKKLHEVLEVLHIAEGNLFGIVALEAAYRYGEPWLEELLEYLEGNGDYIVQFFAEKVPAITVKKPECTYLAWLDCRSLQIDANHLTQFFVQQAKVGLSAGKVFGKPGKGFMRLNFGCPRSVLQEGLERIERAVNNR